MSIYEFPCLRIWLHVSLSRRRDQPLEFTLDRPEFRKRDLERGAPDRKAD
jgi:hypothetical protein